MLNNMNNTTFVNPDLKNFFELLVLKQLFEDTFFPFVNGKIGDESAVQLAERVFNIAQQQGYSEFGPVYRTQLIDSLQECLITYKDICNRYQGLQAKFPDVKFAVLGGWKIYRQFNDSNGGQLGGDVFKVTTEVRIAVGRNALSLNNEHVINCTVYLTDRYNYNYRLTELYEWTAQNNLLIFRDIVQGNAFINFILTPSRSLVTPMRVVVSTSTKQMVRPIPPPPIPCPPAPYPPCPLPPPPPFPPCPPPPYPPCPPPPFPPYPPPVVHETMLIRQVVAERTVGGIKEGSILPRGLSFTQFVEWLLHGQEPEPPEPQPEEFGDILSGAVSLDWIPNEDDLAEFTKTPATSSALEAGISITIPTNWNTMCVAVKKTVEDKILFYGSDGNLSVTPPTSVYLTVNGVEYAVFKWDSEYSIAQTIVLKRS